MPSPHSTPRRGIAMMLVLISLMMGTVLAVSFLSSSDNSAALGENIEVAAEAKWTALSGLEVALAILETNIDWRTLHANGALLSNYPVGAGTITIDLVDVATGAPPTASSQNIQITITSTVGGLEQIALATATVGSSTPDVVDLDLSEFAVFASSNIQLNDYSLISRWSSSPLSGFGQPIALGTRGTSTSTVDLNQYAAAIDTTVYHGPGASSTLVTNTSGPLIDQVGLLDSMPLPDSPGPATTPPADPSTAPDLTPSNAILVTTDARYDHIMPITSSGVITLQGDITVIADDLIKLKNSSGLVIDGNVTLVSYGNFQLDANSYIELRPGATLTLFVDKTITLTNAYIGDERVDKTVFNNSGNATLMDLNRIKIFDIDDGTNGTEVYTLQMNSILKGQVYAPTADVTILDTSALYGRIAAISVTLSGDAAIFYDPALNNGDGYTDPNSTIYDSFSRIKSSILSLASLSDGDYQMLADAESLNIDSDGSILYYSGYTTPTTTDPAPGDPTPRPVVIDSQLIAFGSNLSSWETAKIPVDSPTVMDIINGSTSTTTPPPSTPPSTEVVIPAQ